MRRIVPKTTRSMLLLCGLLLSSLGSPKKTALPPGFVYVQDIDPTIEVHLRYATLENFIHRKVAGYTSNKAILTIQAAQALKKVQKRVRKKGYRIVLYDAYRPQRATNDFIKWIQEEQADNKPYYFPKVDKQDLLKGYLSSHSRHSTGSTVDLSIIPIKKKLHPIKIVARTSELGEDYYFLDDGTVDMGTSFDFLDPLSTIDAEGIAKVCIKNRNFLKKEMEACGFAGYSKEWWHFTLKNEPYPDRNKPFDFPVE